jgi:hypothetical protein
MLRNFLMIRIIHFDLVRFMCKACSPTGAERFHKAAQVSPLINVVRLYNRLKKACLTLDEQLFGPQGRTAYPGPALSVAEMFFRQRPL